jgi:hypothetical protein
MVLEIPLTVQDEAQIFYVGLDPDRLPLNGDGLVGTQPPASPPEDYRIRVWQGRP